MGPLQTKYYLSLMRQGSIVLSFHKFSTPLFLLQMGKINLTATADGYRDQGVKTK